MVVDEPGRAHVRCNCTDASQPDVIYTLEGDRIHDLGILDRNRAIADRVHPRTKDLRIGLAGHEEPLTLGERSNEGGRALPLIRRQITVSRAHRETIGLSHRGTFEDLDSHFEVHDHPPNQGELLIILPTERRQIGLEEAEEPSDDGENAFEMAGPGASTENILATDRSDADRRLTGRIHLPNGRCEDEVDAFRPCEVQVAIEVPRVAVEVLAGTELERIDED